MILISFYIFRCRASIRSRPADGELGGFVTHLIPSRNGRKWEGDLGLNDVKARGGWVGKE